MLNISPYLTIPLITVVVVQIIKFAIHAFTDEIDFKRVFQMGGAPSSVAAAIVAVAFTSVAVDGVGSSVAGVAIALSVVAVVFFCMHQQVREKVNSGLDKKARLSVSSGKDMLIGGIIGFLTSVMLSVSYWKDDMDWFFKVPNDTENIAYFAVFAVLFVIGEALAFWTRRKSMRKLPTSRKLNRAFRISLTAPAIFGLFIAFSQYQTLGMFDIRIWTYITFDLVVLGTIWAYFSVYRSAPKHLKEEREHFNKSKSKSKTKAKKKATKKKKRK